jgi:putative peptidoglycan lipid II flippase
MISKLKNFENNFTVGKAALLIGSLTLASRLIGFFRQYLFASSLGLSDTLDIYVTAFRIPDTIFNLLILGTLSVAFIPVFSGYYMKDKERAMRIANTVLNGALVAMFFICVLLFIFAHPLTKLLVPGFSPEKLAQTATLTRFMLLSPIIFTASNVFSSILSSFKRFFAVNIAAIFYNFGIIAGLLLFYPSMGLRGLGLGVVLGALLHAAIQFPQLYKLGFRWRLVFDYKDSGVKKIMHLFLPRIFGLDISVISLLVASYVGSLLAEGSIAAYQLASDLQAVPIGIFALSTSIALFPILSENFANKDEPRFMQNLEKAVIQILILIIPTTVWMLLFRAQIVRVIYGHGEIGWEQTIILFNTLGVFTLALFSQSLTPLLARAFYARHNTRTPVILGLFSMGINAVSSYFLAQSFGVTGIVAGFAIASFCNCALLFLTLRYSLYKETSVETIHHFDIYLLKNILKIVTAALIAGAVSYAYLYLIEPLVNTRTTLGIFTQVSLAGLAGLASYLLMLYWMRNQFILDFIDKVSIRLNRNR